jgi:hypothetical protein
LKKGNDNIISTFTIQRYFPFFISILVSLCLCFSSKTYCTKPVPLLIDYLLSDNNGIISLSDMNMACDVTENVQKGFFNVETKPLNIKVAEGNIKHPSRHSLIGYIL